MNWKIDYIEEFRFVYVACFGPFTNSDCIEKNRRVLASEFFEPGLPMLFDYRLATFENINLESMREVADFHISRDRQFGDGKMAMLVGSLCQFGLARQYELLTQDAISREIMVFQDEKRAVEWLTEAARPALSENS